MTTSGATLPNPIEYGMLESALNDESWRSIIRIYYETTGGGYVPDEEYLSERHFAVEALRNRSGEFRYGSRFSVHSKLRINNVYIGDEHLIQFDFDPNVDRVDLDPETK